MSEWFTWFLISHWLIDLEPLQNKLWSAEGSHGDRRESMEGNRRIWMCVGKGGDVQGGLLLSDTLYREHHCIGGLIHISQYMLPMHMLFGVSCIYAVFSSVSLFLKFRWESSVLPYFFMDWPRAQQLVRSLPMNPVSLCSRGTNTSSSSYSNSISEPVVISLPLLCFLI